MSRFNKQRVKCRLLQAEKRVQMTIFGVTQAYGKPVSTESAPYCPRLTHPSCFKALVLISDFLWALDNLK